MAEELRRASHSGRLPKALIAVDLYGQCADYDALRSACNRFGVPIIEDAAEAFGASYRGRPAGSLGDMNVLSFNGNKIITTSGGGCLLSDRQDWIEHARGLATQAREPAPHYQHSEVGYNYRLSNLLAAVGRGQLRVLDDRVRRKREINGFYRRALGDVRGITIPAEASYGVGNCWLTYILVDASTFGATPEQIRLHLERHDIESRPLWKPMHLQPVYAGCRFVGPGTSADLFARGLCLPSGTALTEAELTRITTLVREAGLPNQARVTAPQPR